MRMMTGRTPYKNHATYSALPHGTVGSARGGASKRRYCLVNLRFTSGWPPSKYHVACSTTQIVPRASQNRLEILIDNIATRRNSGGGYKWEKQWVNSKRRQDKQPKDELGFAWF